MQNVRRRFGRDTPICLGMSLPFSPLIVPSHHCLFTCAFAFVATTCNNEGYKNQKQGKAAKEQYIRRYQTEKNSERFFSTPSGAARFKAELPFRIPCLSNWNVHWNAVICWICLANGVLFNWVRRRTFPSEAWRGCLLSGMDWFKHTFSTLAKIPVSF